MTPENRFRERLETSIARLTVAREAYEAALMNALGAGWHVADQLEMRETRNEFDRLEREAPSWISAVRGHSDTVSDALAGVIEEMRTASPNLALLMADVGNLPKQ